MRRDAKVRLEPWGPDDLPVLRRTMGDPEMTKHLGGPETEEKLVERHAKYQHVGHDGSGRMFTIVLEDTGQKVGSLGYWEREWRGGMVYETGWSVMTEFQGRGIAAKATGLVIEGARNERKHRYLHAFPKIENLPSNAICRKLGFELLGECDFEFPPGNPIRCNDWRFDLFAGT